ncbi:response regulator [Candidatus Minimicrobia naudis]|uniref:Response regulator n=1 Tax=Candidatus Minimicrobia naudis TaxID=2841263 RepID=A0A8F1MC45_9BACT|nr:response regulator [Candidatus Minimicrobia naudis]
MRLLVIEDERKIARVITESLKREKYAVDVAYDGEEGFNLADSQPYDLLIVDRMLPGLEGTEIVKKLRENGKNFWGHFVCVGARAGTCEDIVFRFGRGG